VNSKRGEETLEKANTEKNPHAVALGRLGGLAAAGAGGRSKSPAKQAASRRNIKIAVERQRILRELRKKAKAS
jgi:hypothetical protein